MSADLTSLLTRHTIECTGPGEVTCRGCRDRGWMSWAAYHAHVADAIEASDWLREQRAMELEATAEAIDRRAQVVERRHVAEALHDRAQAIREGRA